MITRYAKSMVTVLISSKMKKEKVVAQVLLLLRLKEVMMLTCLMFPYLDMKTILKMN